jgi:hypothetical protein
MTRLFGRIEEVVQGQSPMYETQWQDRKKFLKVQKSGEIQAEVYPSE